MTDSTGDQSDARVYSFPRLGFRLTPTATPDAPPDPGDGPPARRVRRSPLTALAALPDPGVRTPLAPALVAGPRPGHVPAAFRSGGDSGGATGPRLGALSLAACLAVAVAALRGTHTFIADRRQRRLATQTETDALQQARAKQRLAELEAAGKHQTAMQGIADKAAQQRAKNRVPSSSEFGNKSLGGRSGGGSSGRSSGGGTKKPTGSGGGASSSRTNGPGPKGRKTGEDTKRSPLGAGARKDGTKGAGLKSGGADGRKGKKDQPKSPTGGKAPRSDPSSPSMERARRRQDRVDNRQGARLQRRADRQAARLENRAKDQGAVRDRKAAAKEARRAAKDQVRNDRVQAKEGRREKARDARFEGKQKQRETKADAKQQKKEAASSEKANRTTLRKALAKEARRRLKRRRKNLAPPVLTKAKKQKKSRKNGKGTPASAGAANTPKINLKKPKNAGTAGGAQAAQKNAQKQKKNKRRWANAQAWARKKAAAGGRFPGGWAPRQGFPGAGATSGAAGSGPNTGQAGPHPGAGQPGGTRQRRSPFQNAGQAAAQAGATHTVTSDHVPGSRAKRWEPDALTQGAPALPSTGPAALDAAPAQTFPRPGTTRPKEARPMPPASGRPDPRITKARKQAARTGQQVTAQARHMDPMHETEITLDDAIDEYGDFKDDAFKTHDKCFKLAERARQLRDTLALFALELAQKHNLTGALFSGAMARLSESMDLLARMADEMQASSLEAAEMAEAADNDLNDAYRPYSIATADAGLSTPSAPIHNET